jgi:hypothetical protein
MADIVGRTVHRGHSKRKMTDHHSTTPHRAGTVGIVMGTEVAIAIIREIKEVGLRNTRSMAMERSTTSLRT